MLTGVELPPESPELDVLTRAKLEAVRPSIVKIRFANVRYLEEIAALLPDVRFLTRAQSEGYSRDEITYGYQSMASAMHYAGLTKRWWGHELANEPNHQAGPWRGLNPWGYRPQLERALLAIGTPETRLILPGLQPMNGTGEWAVMLDSIVERTSGNRLLRGIHVYGQGESVGARITEGLVQAGTAWWSEIVATEIGDSSLIADGWPQDDPQSVRIERNVAVIRELRRRGAAAACLFLIGSSNPRWAGYVFPAQGVRRILMGGSRERRPRTPKPREESASMTARELFEQRFFEARGIGYNPNTAIAMKWRADPRRYGFAITAEEAADDGGVVQTFSNGYALHWDGAQVREV